MSESQGRNIQNRVLVMFTLYFVFMKIFNGLNLSEDWTQYFQTFPPTDIRTSTLIGSVMTIRTTSQTVLFPGVDWNLWREWVSDCWRKPAVNTGERSLWKGFGAGQRGYCYAKDTWHADDALNRYVFNLFWARRKDSWLTWFRVKRVQLPGSLLVRPQIYVQSS